VKTSSLLGHVVEILDSILSGRRPADAVIRGFFRARHYLGSSDRRFIAERAYDILRHYRLLDFRSRCAFEDLGAATDAPSLHPVILLVAHEAGEATRDAGELASDIGALWTTAVALTDCAAFIGSLRRAGPDGGRAGMAIRHSIPDFVAAEWLERFGADEAGALCAASNGLPPVAIRVNTLKGSPGQCRRALQEEGIVSRPGGLSPVGLLLSKRINARELHTFRRGLFEVQDEGSQVLSMLLEARPGMTVLDACAGAGGKSLHLAAIMQNRGKIVALDVDGKKVDNLIQRTRRAGVTILSASVVSPGSTPQVLPVADAVLVDAPCSGVGTFRRNPGAKRLCTEEFSLSLAFAQRELLERYAVAVRTGGRLVYSTCTLLVRENQDVVAGFLSSHPDFSLLSAADILGRQGLRSHGGDPYLELLPHRTGTDGFFAAAMTRS
jgi:16S rRNA (cytosine967-C5)-methyltransferase